MSFLFSFIGYSLKKSFKISRLIRQEKSLSDIVDQIPRSKAIKVLPIASVSQKKIAFLAFFFRFFSLQSGGGIVFSPACWLWGGPLNGDWLQSWISDYGREKVILRAMPGFPWTTGFFAKEPPFHRIIILKSQKQTNSFTGIMRIDRMCCL